MYTNIHTYACVHMYTYTCIYVYIYRYTYTCSQIGHRTLPAWNSYHPFLLSIQIPQPVMVVRLVARLRVPGVSGSSWAQGAAEDRVPVRINTKNLQIPSPACFEGTAEGDAI